MRELTEGPLRAHADGGEVTPEQAERLREAARLIEGLIGFNPSNYGPHMLKGEVGAALGDDEMATQGYLQATFSLPSPTEPVDRVAIGRAQAELSRLALLGSKLEKAEEHAQAALALVPDDPGALVAAASVRIQARDLPAARRYLGQALERDSGYRPALRLRQLIEME